MTTDQLTFFAAGITIGFDLALLAHFGGRYLTARRALRRAQADHEAAAGALADLRGGSWPGRTGGMCARCHLAVGRGDELDPLHPVCLVIHDGMRITRHAADEVLLHLPQWTYWDTQVWSAELGIPAAHLPALKAVLDAHLAHKEADQP